MNKTKLSGFAVHYAEALRTYLAKADETITTEALLCGVEAVAIGLETLEMAKLHQRVLAEVLAAPVALAHREDALRRASLFFAEALLPIEQTHSHATDTSNDLSELTATLDEKTKALADSERDLAHGITARETAESELKLSTARSAALLAESHALDRRLQAMAHEVISANEVERKKMSLQLNDEIAQTLLGIHVRMLALKQEVERHHLDLTSEIAITQRLVQQSVKIIKQLAHEYGLQHESTTARTLAELSDSAE